jgi:serine O-acetyltransferase
MPQNGLPAFAEELATLRRTQSTLLPVKSRVGEFTDGVLGLLFPQISAEYGGSASEIEARLILLEGDLGKLVQGLVDPKHCDDLAHEFCRALPDIYHQLLIDAETIVSGDPAAESLDEVIAAYPGFLAIAMYRIAHELARCEIPVLPRLVAELAHGRTGIDIHPRAVIGGSFCIDHGTGIVIGETAVIGDHVKLYQGVTLGAISVDKNYAGAKRHPTIEDRVVIYANATVLGGTTVIGHDSVVGGNVWITNSVPPFSFVYHSSQVRVRNVGDLLEPSDFVI